MLGTGIGTSVWSGPTYARHRSAVMKSGTGGREATRSGIGTIGSSAKARPAAVSARTVRPVGRTQRPGPLDGERQQQTDHHGGDQPEPGRHHRVQQRQLAPTTPTAR